MFGFRQFLWDASPVRLPASEKLHSGHFQHEKVEPQLRKTVPEGRGSTDFN